VIARGLLASLLAWSCLACSAASSPVVEPAAPARVAGPVPVTLRWTVRNLEQIHGFLVYRSEIPEGPFRRINSEIVLAAEPASTDESGNRYRFDDQTAEPGKRYFYYVDLITTGGLKSRLSGVIDKVAPPASPGSPPDPT